MRWAPRTVWIAWIVWLAACTPSVTTSDNQEPCTGNAIACRGTTLYTCQNGRLDVSATCTLACDPQLGCVSCVPHTGTCSGDTSHACRDDGTGYDDYYCDPKEGLTCDLGSGLCAGACAPQNLGRSYIGCDYWPTVTGNEVDNDFTFAVAVSNTSADLATIVVDGGALAATDTFTVPAGSLVVHKLPWHDGLKASSCFGYSSGCGAPTNAGGLWRKGAYHLRSNQPVTVYQFNALEYVLGSLYSYTNDASLLLPTNVLSGHYVVSTYPGSSDGPSLMTVTATQDGTSVTITSKSATSASNGAPAFAYGQTQTIVLQQGDALQLFSQGDFTGSKVAADKPVQVIGGAYCVYVPSNIEACDHLEESMFPVETLSNKYLVTAPAVPSIPNGKVEVVRIVATEDGTTLAYEPPQPAATQLVNAGDFIEIPNNSASFLISSNHKIQVSQYMEGQNAGGATGDPAMALAVATDQYRDKYLFHAPTNYDTNYVNITAPTGAHITLDNTAVTGFVPIGSSGYALARAVLSKTSGNHSIAGDMKFGISVYGYGRYTSYWYEGGLDLGIILIP